MPEKIRNDRIETKIFISGLNGDKINFFLNPCSHRIENDRSKIL